MDQGGFSRARLGGKLLLTDQARGGGWEPMFLAVMFPFLPGFHVFASDLSFLFHQSYLTVTLWPVRDPHYSRKNLKLATLAFPQ
jgi:hypothetical protein